jgi:hypothetical protein
MADGVSKTTSHPGCIVAAVMVGLLIVVSTCSTEKSKTARSFTSPTLSQQIDAMELPTPAPIPEFDIAAVGASSGQFAKVTKAEGMSGAMIFSQNCYDALSRSFSWSKLDVCGAFDRLAVDAIDTADTQGLAAETEYFGSEAAAGRYLTVAVKAGEDAGKTSTAKPATSRTDEDNEAIDAADPEGATSTG